MRARTQWHSERVWALCKDRSFGISSFLVCRPATAGARVRAHTHTHFQTRHEQTKHAHFLGYLISAGWTEPSVNVFRVRICLLCIVHCHAAKWTRMDDLMIIISNKLALNVGICHLCPPSEISVITSCLFYFNQVNKLSMCLGAGASWDWRIILERWAHWSGWTGDGWVKHVFLDRSSLMEDVKQPFVSL